MDKSFWMGQSRERVDRDWEFENCENSDLTITGLTIHQVSILQKVWERTPEAEISEGAKNIMSHLLRSNAQMYQFFNLVSQNPQFFGRFIISF